MNSTKSVYITIIIGLAGLLLTAYQIFSKEETLIEIECKKTLLTQYPDIPGLSAHLQFQDSILLTNLWKLYYTFRNVGDKNIIGEGVNTSLIGKGLPIYFENVRNVVAIFSKNDIAVEDESVLYFKQWKPGELIIIEAYVESTGVEPALCIDKRDIVDAEISLLE